jgi:hypothetical protein
MKEAFDMEALGVLLRGTGDETSPLPAPSGAALRVPLARELSRSARFLVPAALPPMRHVLATWLLLRGDPSAF